MKIEKRNYEECIIMDKDEFIFIFFLCLSFCSVIFFVLKILT